MQKTQERIRIERGLQCPECYGAQTYCRYSLLTKQDDTHSFECRDCGCNWSEPIRPVRAA